MASICKNIETLDLSMIDNLEGLHDSIIKMRKSLKNIRIRSNGKNIKGVLALI